MNLTIFPSLKEKIRPEWTSLIIIDYQNDFCALEGAFGKTGAAVSRLQSIEPALVNLISSARGRGIFIIFVKSIYSTRDNRYLSRAFLEQARRRRTGRYFEVSVCQQDGWGSDFYGRVRPQGDAIVEKHRFSAFVGTELDLLLRSRRIETIIATGVTTNCCVESTVRNGFFKDYHLVVPQDCVAAFEDELHRVSLKNIDNLFGEVTSGEEIIKCWE